jgi:hypothetical protein
LFGSLPVPISFLARQKRAGQTLMALQAAPPGKPSPNGGLPTVALLQLILQLVFQLEDLIRSGCDVRIVPLVSGK